MRAEQEFKNGETNNIIRKKKRRLNPDFGNEGEDRLSSLPECLLHGILSLLDLQSATATSILSRQWCYRWTHLTDFIFHCYRLPKPGNLTLGFFTHVDHILHQLNCHQISSFGLDFPYGITNEDALYCSVYLSLWVEQLCARNALEISVSVTSHDAHVDPIIVLPSTLFECKYLVELDLYGQFCFDLMGNVAVISFPNLTTLRLSLCGSNLHWLDTLLKSCPLLSYLDLVLYLLDAGHSVDIFSPRLKKFSICINQTRREAIDASKFVINAPKLEHFFSIGDLVLFHFNPNPSTTLLVVEFQTWARTDGYNLIGHKSLDLLLRFIRQIASVQKLVLCSQSIRVSDCIRRANGNGGNGNGIVRPTFPNIIHLKLMGIALNDIDWKAALPGTMLFKLKKIEIYMLKGRGIEIELVEYILTEAVALDQLSISAPCCITARDISRALFIPKQRKFGCRVNFEGVCYCASGEGLEDRLIPCRIVCQDDEHLPKCVG